MAAVDVRETIRKRIEKASEGLISVEHDIKRITGRDADDLRENREFGRTGRQQNFDQEPRRPQPGFRPEGSSRLFHAARQGIGGPAARRLSHPYDARPAQRGRVQSRLGRRAAEEEDYAEELSNKPSVQSSVVATDDSQSKEEFVAKQGSGEVKTRNKRMFAGLMKHLTGFKKEEKTQGDKLAARRAVEEKLVQKENEEKRKLSQEKDQLLEDRRRAQAQLRSYHRAEERCAEHEEWADRMQELAPHIRTQSRPHVFYRPKILIAETEIKLRQSQKWLQDTISKQHSKMKREVEEVLKATEERQPEVAGREERPRRDSHTIWDEGEDKQKEDRRRERKRSERSERERRKSEQSEKKRRVSEKEGGGGEGKEGEENGEDRVVVGEAGDAGKEKEGEDEQVQEKPEDDEVKQKTEENPEVEEKQEMEVSEEAGVQNGKGSGDKSGSEDSSSSGGEED